MTGFRRARELARRILPAGVRRAVRGAVSRARPPVLSVVVPMYNVERYVGDCLDSVLAQDFESIEVLVVDDGSTDGSPEIVRAVASRDRRVTLLSQANAGQGPARNLAVDRARGEFLVFVDSDDLIPPGSFRSLVAAMRRSGSDFAVGGVRRLAAGETFRPSWTVVVHEHDRTGITIEDFPAAMADVVAHHRIFRRGFWIEEIGGFSAGVYEDHVPMVAAYLRARRFDVLSRVVYEWRLRTEGTSTGQQKHDLANLETRIAVKAIAREMVWREAKPAVRAAWVGRVLDIDFPPYVEQGLHADGTYRRTLSDALASYVALATPEALRYVRVRQKIRTHLAARGEWDALRRVEQVFEEQGSIPPTAVRQGAVTLVRSPAEGTGITLPSELLELSHSECRLQICLAGCQLVGQNRLRLTGWALVRAIDLSSRMPAIKLSLVNEDDTGRITLPAEPVPRPEATVWVGWPHGSFERAGFQADVDLASLLDKDRPSITWRLQAQVEVDGVRREGGAYHALAGSSASRAALAGRRIEIGRVVAAPRFDRERGFVIAVQTADTDD